MIEDESLNGKVVSSRVPTQAEIDTWQILTWNIPCGIHPVNNVYYRRRHNSVNKFEIKTKEKEGVDG